MINVLICCSEEFPNVEPLTLKIGTNNHLGQTIEVLPIRTTSALCYKVESMSKFNPATSLIFSVWDLNRKKSTERVLDNIENIQMYVAARNTWQGVIYGSWQNTNKPLKVIGELSDNTYNLIQVPIKVTERSHLKGNGNFSECLERGKPTGESCKSMFYPNSYNEDSRFVLKSCQKIQPT